MTTFTSDDVNKLKQLVNEGIQVKGEMEALREGLKDTVTAIAEELDIKPAVLNKAISIAYKAEFSRAKDDFDELESILETVGRTL
jgi:vacuolar-type H+-ATPase subunit I/STV1